MATVGDNPISRPEQDALDRTRLARTIASELRDLDASQGFVVGVLGPWGSGKTSLVNLVRFELELDPRVPVLEFNPWMFSGAEQLVDSFFNELAAQLRHGPDTWKNIADDIEAYSDVLAPLQHVPLIGTWTERIRGGAALLKKIRDARREGIGARRARLSQKLAALEGPIVVVIDDIDRLHTSEIRDIFKLVRLTANFPNVIYLLAFDRHRVEDALAEDGLPGRDYLEKILQVAFDLPAVPSGVLLNRLTQAIDAGLADVAPTGPFDEDRWPNVLLEVIAPLVRHMRDVRRFVASLRGTFRDLDGKVAMVDVLGLEAIRVFLPDVFVELPKAQAGLTTTASFGGRDYESPALKASVERLIEASGDRSDVVRALINRLFPAGLRHIENNRYGPDWLGGWLRDRRVAHADILSFYLERVSSSGLIAFTKAEEAFPLLGDAAAFDQFLSGLPANTIEDVISALENYEGKYPPATVVPAVGVLLNWLDRLPDRPRGLFDLDNRLVIGRVTLRMLRAFKTPEEVETATRAILPALKSLTAKYELITTVGYQEGAGHKLVAEAGGAALEADLRQQIRDASAIQLASESDLLRLLLFVHKTKAADEPNIVLPRTREFELALLKTAVTKVRSQSADSRAVRTSERLAWDALVTAVGNEDQLNELVDRVTRTNRRVRNAKVKDLVALAQKYRGGWRPERFGDDDDDDD